MALVVIIIIIVIIAAGIKIIPQSKAYVVERLGAYDRTMQTGLNYSVCVQLITRICHYFQIRF